ncbi:MAG: DUF4339 domain-containing protein [Armatimonadetes bacterium]|nr:DUF4339 domain-containing protein [Armatimonadota bacterium]
MISPDQLRSICRKYSGRPDYYSGGDIPTNKLMNAKKSLRIPGTEDVYAVIDCTVFGSAKDAIVVAASGIYAKNTDSSGPQYFSWKELAELNILSSRESLTVMEVVFSNGRKLNCVGQTMGVNDGIIPLLNDLLGVLRAAEESMDWFVVADGAQQGPYSRKALKQMVTDGVIVPAATSVWRDGMPSWVPMHTIPELAARPKGPTPPPFVPPQAAGPTPPPFPSSPGEQQPQTQAPLQPQAPARTHTPAQTGTGTSTSAPPTGLPTDGIKTRFVDGERGSELVDINSAEADRLVLLPSMTLAHARLIENERQARLGFTTVEEVGQLLGLEPHQVERLRPLVTFSVYSPAGGVAPAGKRLIDF